MKHKVLKFSITILLPIIIGIMFLGAGCENKPLSGIEPEKPPNLCVVDSTLCDSVDVGTPCACGVVNPQENIEWLAHILRKSFYAEVYSIRYKEQEYIGIYDRPKIPDTGAVIYDCCGNEFCAYIGFTGKWTCDDINTDEFRTALRNKVLIYIQETNPYWEK